MPLPPELLTQALRTPETQDVTETPIVRAIILQDPSNAADLVPPLATGPTLEARNARRILCRFGPDAAPPLLTALADSGSAYARMEGAEILWSLLNSDDPQHTRSALAGSVAELTTLLSDETPLPVEIPESVEQDFKGRVCDLFYVVVQELMSADFDQSQFRTHDDQGRNQAIREMLSRSFQMIS